MNTLKAPPDSTLIILIAFAGTGKYTIGRELSERTGAKLIDNHLINNPVFTAVNADGVTPLPGAVWDKVKAIRRIVYEAICEIAPPELSFIFTLVYIPPASWFCLAFDDAGLRQLRSAP